MIILASLFLHLLFFVISQDYKLSEHYKSVAEQEVSALASEMTAPFGVMDQVSMSVIAMRYIKHDTLDYVGVYDNQGNVIVPVGQENPTGFVAKETIISGDQVLGSVVVQTPTVSRATIIASNWLFFVGVMGLHVIIWLVYGYFARPTQELKDEIANDVRNRLLANGILSPHLQIDKSEKTEPLLNTEPKAETEKTDKTDNTHTDDTDSTEKTDKKEKRGMGSILKAQFEHFKPKATPIEDTQSAMVVQTYFDDPNGLLETLGVHAKSAYFALCDQLLQKACTELLALPLLAGVSVSETTTHDDKGAKITLIANDDKAQLALASVMLAKLMLMLNQIVYDKHRELKRFCLPMRTFVSDIDQQDEIITVGKKHRDTPLILVSESSLEQLAEHVELRKLLDPTTVGERESRYLKKQSETIGEHLKTVRDNVLLSD